MPCYLIVPNRCDADVYTANYLTSRSMFTLCAINKVCMVETSSLTQSLTPNHSVSSHNISNFSLIHKVHNTVSRAVTCSCYDYRSDSMISSSQVDCDSQVVHSDSADGHQNYKKLKLKFWMRIMSVWIRPLLLSSMQFVLLLFEFLTQIIIIFVDEDGGVCVAGGRGDGLHQLLSLFLRPYLIDR